MTWRPNKTRGLVAGLIIGAMLAVGLGTILNSLRLQSADLGAVASVLMLGLTVLAMLRWAVRLYGLISLHYRLDRNALIIHYGAHEHTIPLGSIIQVAPVGSRFRVSPVWPGYYANRATTDPLCPTWIHGTLAPDQHMLIHTADAQYAISPANPERFLDDLATLRGMGPVREMAHETHPVGIAAWQVWRDRPYWLVMILAAMANLSLYAIHVTGLGDTPSTGLWARVSLMTPIVGSGILVLNLAAGIILYRQERLATWLLLLIALFAQVLLATTIA